MLEKTVKNIITVCQRIKSDENRLRGKTFLVPPSLKDAEEVIKFFFSQALPLISLPQIPACFSQIEECLGVNNYYFIFFLFAVNRLSTTYDAMMKNYKQRNLEEAAKVKLNIQQGYRHIVENFGLMYDGRHIKPILGFVKNVAAIVNNEKGSQEVSKLALLLAEALLTLNEQVYIRRCLEELISMLMDKNIVKKKKQKENLLLPMVDFDIKPVDHLTSSLLVESDKKQNTEFVVSAPLPPPKKKAFVKLKSTVHEDLRTNTALIKKIKHAIKNKKIDDLDNLLRLLASTPELPNQLEDLLDYAKKKTNLLAQIAESTVIIDIIKKYQLVHAVQFDEKVDHKKYSQPWNRYVEAQAQSSFQCPVVSRTLRLKPEVDEAVEKLAINLQKKIDARKNHHQNFSSESDNSFLDFPYEALQRVMRCMQLIELFREKTIAMLIGGLPRDIIGGKKYHDMDIVINLTENDLEKVLKGLIKNHHEIGYEIKPYTKELPVFEVTFQGQVMELACDPRLVLNPDGSLNMVSLQTVAEHRDLNINTICFDTYGNIYDVYQIMDDLIDTFRFGKIKPFINLCPKSREEIAIVDFIDDWEDIYKKLKIISSTIQKDMVECNLRKLVFDPSIYIKLLEKIQCEKVDNRLLVDNLAILFVNPMPKLIIHSCSGNRSKLLKASLLLFEKLLRSIITENRKKFSATMIKEAKIMGNFSPLKELNDVKLSMNKPFYRELFIQFLTSGVSTKEITTPLLVETLNRLLHVDKISDLKVTNNSLYPLYDFLFRQILSNYDENKKIDFKKIASALAAAIYVTQKQKKGLPAFEPFEKAVKEMILNIPFLSQFYHMQINNTGTMKLPKKFYMGLKDTIHHLPVSSPVTYWSSKLPDKKRKMNIAKLSVGPSSDSSFSPAALS